MRVGFYHAAAKETEHVAMAAQLVRSVRRFMPGVPIVHLTDQMTPPIDGVDAVTRLNGGPVALACVEAYATCAGDWLFVDTDVIVQRDVRHVFDQPFDIAVATREGTLLKKEVGTKFMDRMPFNKGAVFSRSIEFWIAAAAWLRGQSDKDKAWAGDQEAMNQIIRSGAFAVVVLPNTYNYPPFRADEDISAKAIVHYKGPRKAWLRRAA